MTKPQEKSTMVELVAELEKMRTAVAVLDNQTSAFLEETIAEAKAGEYHDFKNEKYACGKIEVVNRLRVLGNEALAKRVIAGEFDESPDEADKEAMRKDLPKHMWARFGLEPKPSA